MELSRIIPLIAVLTSVSISWSYLDSTLFAWHPICMTIGFVSFMTWALLDAIEFRAFQDEERRRAIWNHTIKQIIAVMFAIIAFVAIYWNKIRHGKTHFASYHGKVRPPFAYFNLRAWELGLLTMMGAGVSVLLGIGSFQSLGLYRQLPMIIQRRIKAIHRLSGSTTWILSCITIELGLGNPGTSKGMWTTLWQGSVLIIASLMIYLLFTKSARSKTQLPLDVERL